jgi:hypothetical protein
VPTHLLQRAGAPARRRSCGREGRHARTRPGTVLARLAADTARRRSFAESEVGDPPRTATSPWAGAPDMRRRA